MKRSGRYGYRLRLSWRKASTKVLGSREEGSAIVELAMVLPVLSMLLVGIISSGITFYDYVVLADAVAVGARTLATNRGNGNACTLGETALKNAATNLKQSSITIASETFSGTGGSTCSAIAANDTATMSATYPCSLTVPFTKVNLCPVQNGNNSFISAQTTVRIE